MRNQFTQSSQVESLKYILKYYLNKCDSILKSLKNTLPAILLLLNDLNKFELDEVVQACENRKKYLRDEDLLEI